MNAPLPTGLAEIRAEFLALEEADRLELLLEFADDLPALPERLVEHPELTERVEECQAPVFIALEVTAGGVQMHAAAPPEAPTTRGFASILARGIGGLSPSEVAAIPADYPLTLGLTRLVSPLRLSGMTGMLLRAKRQVAELSGTRNPA